MYFMLNLILITFFFFIYMFSSKISKMVFLSIILVMLCSKALFFMSMNSWISMSMFLSIVGGLLVLFSLVASVFSNTLEQSSSMFFPVFFLLLLEIFLNFNLGEMILPVSVNFNVELVFFLIFILNYSLMLISKMIFFNEKLFRFSSSQLKLVS